MILRPAAAPLLRLASVGCSVLLVRSFAVTGTTGTAISAASRRAFLATAASTAPTNARSSQSCPSSSSSSTTTRVDMTASIETESGVAATASAEAAGDKSKADDENNPLLSDWSTNPYHLPPFASIEPNHFPPAFDVAMDQHLDDLRAIVDAAAESEPTFELIVAAYDRAGTLMSRIGSVYGNYCSSLNTDAMKEIQSEMSPKLSRHTSKVASYPGLFDAIDAVHKRRHDAELTPEQLRLVERIHLDLTRRGAHFTPDQQEKYADIQAELATLQTTFMQNVMKDEEEWELILTKPEELEGCPSDLINAMRSIGKERNKAEGEHVLTLSRSIVEPFLTFASNRELRKKAFEAWTKRGELHPERDNLAIATKILKLRKTVAEMHGCKTFAEYQCLDTMARKPENVMNLLENVWNRAKVAADREREMLEQYVTDSGDDLGPDGIQSWDWRYYAEKVRSSAYDFDESELKPYLSLDGVTDAAMSVSNRLFGLKFEKQTDVQGYHPDVNVYEVKEATSDGTGEDKLVALFLHDNYARPYKSSGAWMSEFRSQTRNLPDGSEEIESIPVVVNNNNFAKSETSALLSFDDATTLFHEFGHGHHGMLSDATYSRLSSTSVLRDFVELPSQLMERWLETPEVLKEYAKHVETGEPVPDALLEKFNKAKKFNEGFATIEYTACALLDMALHSLDSYDDDTFDLSKFEETELARLGMPQGIVMRHRPAHFAHLFASHYYAAGYYVYQWAQVLDADAFGAFVESGDVFDPEVARKARKFIYGAGNTVAPDELFRQFRGRDPDVKFLLERLGLA